MILFCHTVGNNVLMPSWLYVIADNGQIGVDIFLFLSGLGISVSLSNHTDGLAPWYKKRFTRIFVPYTLITVVYLIYKMLFENVSLTSALLNYTTIGYWIDGNGAWFIALIIILYAFAPLLYKITSTRLKWLWLLAISFMLMILCNSNVTSDLHYLQLGLRRAPSFIIGMGLANEIKNGARINVVYAFLIPMFIFLVLSVILPQVYCRWIIIPPLVIIGCYMIDIFKFMDTTLIFMGSISLESYLTNIYLGDVLNHKSWIIGGIDLSYGHYIEYLVVLILGIWLAYLTNKVSKSINIR